MRRSLGAVALIALASCGVETVGITMDLRYDPGACGGCSPSAATLPSESVLALAISDADTEEVLVPRCFTSSGALTVAELPATLRNSEFNDIALPGDRRLVARLEIHSPGATCDDPTAPSLLTATSAATVPEESSHFLLIVECPGGALCAL